MYNPRAGAQAKRREASPLPLRPKLRPEQATRPRPPALTVFSLSLSADGGLDDKIKPFSLLFVFVSTHSAVNGGCCVNGRRKRSVNKKRERATYAKCKRGIRTTFCVSPNRDTFFFFASFAPLHQVSSGRCDDLNLLEIVLSHRPAT